MLKMILPSLHEFLKHQREGRFRAEDQRDLALNLLLKAINETRLYLQRTQRQITRDRKTEETLVRLWAEAAVPVRHLDRDLAERCTMKSDYWLNPESYSPSDIHKFRIGINQVYQEVKDLL